MVEIANISHLGNHHDEMLESPSQVFCIQEHSCSEPRQKALMGSLFAKGLTGTLSPTDPEAQTSDVGGVGLLVRRPKAYLPSLSLKV